LIVIAAKLLLITRLRILLSAAEKEEEFAMLPESGIDFFGRGSRQFSARYSS
jgi:hypothetical protein